MNAGSLTAGQTTNFSEEAWIKTTTAANQYFVAEGSTSTNVPFDGIYLDSTHKPAFTVRDNVGTQIVLTGSSAVNDGRWHQVVGVRNGATMSLYVDGKQAATASASALGAVALNTTTVGALKRTTVSNYFSGSIDEAAVYVRALGAAEINGHYRAGTSNYAGTIAPDGPALYWRFGERVARRELAAVPDPLRAQPAHEGAEARARVGRDVGPFDLRAA